MSATVIQLANGIAVDLRSFHVPAEVTVQVAAHHLAQINRYTGAALRPISVAEHSLLVLEIARRELGLDVHGQLMALAHDMHECVVGDCSSPMKVMLGDAWRAIEDRWAAAFRRAFHLQTAHATQHEQVRRADLIALATERRDGMAPSDLEWSCLHGIEPVSWHRLKVHEQRPWQAWAAEFVDAFDRLDFERLRATGLSA